MQLVSDPRTRDQVSVLVVDDEHAIRALVSDFLELVGCEVRVAAHGFEALECLHEFQPDLILLDLMMPDMDGRTFGRSIRGQPWGATVPIVVMSAAPGAQDVCREIKAQGCLAKPFDLDDLARVVEQLGRAR